MNTKIFNINEQITLKKEDLLNRFEIDIQIAHP